MLSLESAHTDYAIYREVVAQLMNGQEQLPSLPSITLDIRRALGQPDTSMQSLSKLIARDPSLTAILLKYAPSVMLHTHMPPQTLFDVIRLLGMTQVERITMVHSVKSLFTLHSAGHKRLFMEAWDRLISKASTSAFLARALGKVVPDHALLASFLSEIGTLAVLSAFKSRAQIPSRDVYVTLCREYSKSLGVIMLKKWQVDDEYVQVVRKTGDWLADSDDRFGLVDVVNLGLYHSLKARMTANRLPPLTELGAYQKLSIPNNFITDTGELEIVVTHRKEIRLIADSLR